MSWKMAGLLVMGCVLAYVWHGPLRAPLVEDLSAQVEVPTAFSGELDLSKLERGPLP